MSLLIENSHASAKSSPLLLAGGLLVALSLFYLMAYMIEMAITSVEQHEPLRMADVVMPDRDIDTRYKLQKPEKPEIVQAAPELPRMEFQSSEISRDMLNIDVPDIDVGVARQFALGGGEGDYLPIVKVQPIYPRRALQRGISGYVIVEFTVTTSGSVKDVSVVEEDPAGVFSSAAIKAASKFKYKPRVVDGEPVEVLGVRNKIIFALEE